MAIRCPDCGVVFKTDQFPSDEVTTDGLLAIGLCCDLCHSKRVVEQQERTSLPALLIGDTPIRATGNPGRIMGDDESRVTISLKNRLPKMTVEEVIDLID